MQDEKRTKTPSLSDILRIISDDKTRALFINIALSPNRPSNLIRETQLTTKQYYSRLSGLMQQDLIKRCQGKYSLSTLGKVVYQIYSIMEKAISHYWKMKVIDSIQLSSYGESREELSVLIDSLIDDHQLRDTLTRAMLSSHGKENVSSLIDRAKGGP
jgi:predicted transcriptional regulator